jgi:hypothetical protein
MMLRRGKTRTGITEMTPEAQRIALAEACGWKTAHNGKYCTSDLANLNLATLFDPLNDLNAMHEAILSLTEKRTRQIFEMTLLEVCRPEICRDPDEDMFAHIEHLRTNPDAYIGWFEVEHGNAFPIINATAAQRCEAFLRTLNLWKD